LTLFESPLPSAITSALVSSLPNIPPGDILIMWSASCWVVGLRYGADRGLEEAGESGGREVDVGE